MAKYINAEKFIQRIRNEIKEQLELSTDEGYTAFLNGFKHIFEEKVKEEPSADVQEVKHGKWISQGADLRPRLGVWHCTNCGSPYGEPSPSKYCPHCGAKMEKE